MRPFYSTCLGYLTTSPTCMFSLVLLVHFVIHAAALLQVRGAGAGMAGDAPFSVDPAALKAAVTCPNGIRKAPGGVVFLVHGTGATGYGSWANSPYGVYLPWATPGFDICWVNLPGNSLVDAQVSAEYVAYNIPVLAAQSATGKVSIIGHSQGAGLNPQWALIFWPSTHQYISDYIALAGDFHGTVVAPLACLPEDLLEGGCYPAVTQQSVGSKYLAAQNRCGGQALVTTTSIYTLYDDTVQPEVTEDPTSVLPGATNIALQDGNVCGPGHLANHFTMLFDPAAFALAYDALTHDGPASPARFNAIKYCSGFANNTGLDLSHGPNLARDYVLATLRNGGASAVKKVYSEPPLKAYVCQ